MNIAIMRAFVSMRQMMTGHEDLKRKIEEMESKYDKHFRVIFEAIRRLLVEDENRRGELGFDENVK